MRSAKLGETLRLNQFEQCILIARWPLMYVDWGYIYGECQALIDPPTKYWRFLLRPEAWFPVFGSAHRRRRRIRTRRRRKTEVEAGEGPLEQKKQSASGMWTHFDQNCGPLLFSFVGQF